MPQFTATEQRMIDVLRDGGPHTREELHACLNDELGDLANVWAHLTRLRRKLRPGGHDILCTENGQTTYRIVRLLASPYDGKR